MVPTGAEGGGGKSFYGAETIKKVPFTRGNFLQAGGHS